MAVFVFVINFSDLQTCGSMCSDIIQKSIKQKKLPKMTFLFFIFVIVQYRVVNFRTASHSTAAHIIVQGLARHLLCWNWRPGEGGDRHELCACTHTLGRVSTLGVAQHDNFQNHSRVTSMQWSAVYVWRTVHSDVSSLISNHRKSLFCQLV